jgi:2-iminobutanoate/2-iminopropanoate deaminase
MPRQKLSSSRAPKAVGPYSSAIRAGDFIFVSGMGPIDPSTGQVVRDDFEHAVRQTLQNVRSILEDNGASMDAVVKTTVYLKDMERFLEMNGIYAQYFGDPAPARTTVQAARLPLDIDIEIEAIAYAAQT